MVSIGTTASRLSLLGISSKRRAVVGGDAPVAPSFPVDMPLTLESTGDVNAPVTGDVLSIGGLEVPTGTPTPTLSFLWQERTNGGSWTDRSETTDSLAVGSDGFTPEFLGTSSTQVINTTSVSGVAPDGGTWSLGDWIGGPGDIPTPSGWVGDTTLASVTTTLNGVITLISDTAGAEAPVTTADTNVLTIGESAWPGGVTFGAYTAGAAPELQRQKSYRCKITASNGVTPDVVVYTPPSGYQVG